MMGPYKKLIRGLAMIVAALPVLSACSMYAEGHVTPNRVQVSQDRFSEEIAVSALDSAAIAALAKYYDHHGDGGLEMTIMYDPLSRFATAMDASSEASRIVGEFRKNGVRDVRSGILPIKNLGEEQRVLITFDSYTAHAPKDCSVLPGVESTKVEADKDYKIGCTIETLFAKQVARPKDLRGGTGIEPTSSGRRAANIVDTYRTGVPNEPLGGESASEQ